MDTKINTFQCCLWILVKNSEFNVEKFLFFVETFTMWDPEKMNKNILLDFPTKVKNLTIHLWK